MAAIQVRVDDSVKSAADSLDRLLISIAKNEGMSIVTAVENILK
jgi:antitoxin component of RelBE/YafQ-DinJ toxin-antitoxin module